MASCKILCSLNSIRTFKCLGAGIAPNFCQPILHDVAQHRARAANLVKLLPGQIDTCFDEPITKIASPDATTMSIIGPFSKYPFSKCIAAMGACVGGKGCGTSSGCEAVPISIATLEKAQWYQELSERNQCGCAEWAQTWPASDRRICLETLKANTGAQIDALMDYERPKWAVS